MSFLFVPKVLVVVVVGGWHLVTRKTKGTQRARTC